jgi:hypothetical protein
MLNVWIHCIMSYVATVTMTVAVQSLNIFIVIHVQPKDVNSRLMMCYLRERATMAQLLRLIPILHIAVSTLFPYFV